MYICSKCNNPSGHFLRETTLTTLVDKDDNTLDLIDEDVIDVFCADCNAEADYDKEG
jgi:hypothetical protein